MQPKPTAFTISLILLVTCLAPAAHAQPSPEAIAFYHLRFDLQTTSDWTLLRIIEAPHALTFRQGENFGTLTNLDIGADYMAINQPLGDAEAGSTVGVVVDYAISAEVGPVLTLELTRGSLNASTVRVYAVTPDGPVLLKDVNHTLPNENDDPTNPLRFSVDLSAAPATQNTHQRTDYPKLLWAFYYPWYTLHDWQSDILLDTPAEPYASDDETALAHHIEQAQAAGIDGFISSWWGPDSDTNDSLALLLDLALARGFKITVNFETLGDDGPQRAGVIEDWLRYLLSTYGDHPAFMQLNGKPVVFIWASATVELRAWASIFSLLRADGLDAYYLAMGYDTSALAVFDGLHTYGLVGFEDVASVMSNAGRAVRYYNLLEPDVADKLWVATAQPGYDDHLIPGRAGFIIERDGGDFYRTTFEAAINSQPDWIVISTWNEWWEHTHIEPSQLYGEQYLDLTREYEVRWHHAPR